MDDNMRNAWLDMISKFYTDLHNSDRVLKASNVSDKKRERLLKYFERLEELHNKVSKTKSVNGEKLLKSFYYDLYVIKPENIPDAYFQNQVRLARERGYGNIKLTEEDKRRMTEEVIDDQKKSLDKWIEYFLYDEESKSYGMWEKYWVFQGLQNLGKYDKETGKFSKRDKSTVYPFPPVEREYIFTTLKLMEDFLKDKKSEEDIKQALSTGNFKLLYEYVIKQSFLKGEHQSNNDDGKWIKYEQGSDYNILRDSLQGYYTGWCTAAGENFAKSQLAGGDFYVYYSLDKNGEAKVPRIAIRMDGKYEIGEIRGIADNQNMEPEMMSILEEKLKEFPDRGEYLKKEHDMKLLTLIDKKVNNNIELTLDELKFLYEIDDQIKGFGYEEDPRIKEIKRKRKKRRDYSLIFNVKEEEVALSQKEWEKSPDKFKILVGNLSLAYDDIGDLPQYVEGDLFLDDVENAEWLVFPQRVGGDLPLNSLESSNGVVLPKYVGGNLSLESLESAKGLVLPKYIGGDLNLESLESARGLVLPKYIGGDLSLNCIESADGLTLPQHVGGDIYLSSLASADGLVLPESIGGGIDLSSLTSADGLILPQHVGGDIDLRSLASADGLTLPQHVGGYLALDDLESVDGLTLPKYVGNDLYLANLDSVDGLVLPQHVGGDLDLNMLKSADGLVLPQHVGGDLYLKYRLESAEGLVLPHYFDLNKLYCPYNIKEEIMNNPDKYYMKPPMDEEKKGMKK